ncbi:MAG: DMT family transporter [Oscillospiraceae bacterium]
MNDKSQSRLGRIALFSATLIWGTSFVVLKSTLDSVPVLTILAIRFLGAALIMLASSLRELKKLDFSTLKSGMLMGVLLFLAYIFQTYGLSLTTPGKNAFLTSVYCVIVPFLYWLIRHRRPDGFNIAAAVICIAGVGLVSLDGGMSVSLGDGLTLVCGVIFAFHIIATDAGTEKHSVLLLSMLQMAVAGILAAVCAVIFEPMPPAIPSEAILPIIYLCVMCTAASFFLQTFGQKRTSPSSAAVIMTFESVFGTLLSICTGAEDMSFRLISGFILIFAAVIISETKLSFLRGRPAADLK